MWRIAQEAVTNVERHAQRHPGAGPVALRRRVGRPRGRRRRHRLPRSAPAGRLDSYGILGMRERAASIGATLEIDCEPDEGTRVRCSLLRMPRTGGHLARPVHRC